MGRRENAASFAYVLRIATELVEIRQQRGDERGDGGMDSEVLGDLGGERVFMSVPRVPREGGSAGVRANNATIISRLRWLRTRRC